MVTAEEGTRDTKNKLDTFAEKILTDVAFKVHAEIVRNTPVDTGRLRASIKPQKIGPNTWVIGTNVEYAPFVEARAGMFAIGIHRIPLIMNETLGMKK